MRQHRRGLSRWTRCPRCGSIGFRDFKEIPSHRPGVKLYESRPIHKTAKACAAELRRAIKRQESYASLCNARAKKLTLRLAKLEES